MTEIPAAFRQPDFGSFVAGGIEVPPIPPTASPGPQPNFALTGWKRKEEPEQDVQVPSGQWCRVRKLGSKDLFKLGIIDMLDMFSPDLLGGVQESNAAKAQRQASEMQSLLDKDKRDRLFDTVDKVISACVIMPRVVSTPEEIRNPDTDVLIEDIEIADKMFIFGVAFGNDVSALKSADAEQTADLGNAQHSDGLRSEAE